MNAAADVGSPPGVEFEGSRRLRQTQGCRGRAAHVAQGRWIVIEAEVSVWRNLEIVTICGRADDRVVGDGEGSRRHCHVLARDRLGVVDKPGASCAAAAQIVVDRRERSHASAGDLLAVRNRAGSHGADSEHSVTLCHSLRRNSPFGCVKSIQSGPAGGPGRFVRRSERLPLCLVRKSGRRVQCCLTRPT